MATVWCWIKRSGVALAAVMVAFTVAAAVTLRLRDPALWPAKPAAS
jgi:hypothetical protein